MALKHQRNFMINVSFKGFVLSSIIISSLNKNNVKALINPNAGFSYITFDKSDVCSNIFNDNPCGYMKNILKVFLDTSEQEKSMFMGQIKRLEEEVELLKTLPRKRTPKIAMYHNFSKRSNVIEQPAAQKKSPGLLHVLRNINHVLSKYIQNMTRFSMLKNDSMSEKFGNVSV